MKNINLIIIFCVLSCISLNAQSNIKVKENKHIILLFQSNIESGIVSNDDYSFEYNPEKPDNIALLKAKSKNAEETSLIVKTSNGTIFNLTISYGPTKENIIKISDSLGYNTKNISNPNTKAIEPNNNSNLSSISTTPIIQESIKENDYTIGNITINDQVNSDKPCDECKKVLNAKKSIKRILDEEYKVKIQLNNIFYRNNKLFIQLNIDNASDLDYNINYIKSYISTGNDNKSTTSQYLEKYPIQIYNSKRSIPGGTERIFVFVFEQFTIDNNKVLVFEVNENNGERNLFLNVPHYLINNPRKLKL